MVSKETIETALKNSSKFAVFNNAPREHLDWLLENALKRIELYGNDLNYHEQQLRLLHEKMKEDMILVAKLEEYFETTQK